MVGNVVLGKLRSFAQQCEQAPWPSGRETVTPDHARSPGVEPFGDTSLMASPPMSPSGFGPVIQIDLDHAPHTFCMVLNVLT